MEMNIREWKRSDLSNIRATWIDFCRNATRSDMQLIPNAEPALLEWLTDRFKEPGVFGFIAEKDGASAGFLIGRVNDWDSVPPVVKVRKLGIIDAVYVHEEFRRQGIGTRLIERAFQTMREQNVVAVETIYDAWSEAASQTWSRAGFAPWMVHAFRML